MANGITEARDRKIKDLEDELIEWIEGRKSHWNYYVSACPNPADASALCSIADAAEVCKLSGAIVALRTSHG